MLCPLQDTGDTRETPAIDVCHGLLSDGARLCICDPQVSKDKIYRCVSADFGTSRAGRSNVQIFNVTDGRRG